MGRHSEVGRIYHVRSATEGRQPLFRDLFAGRGVVQCMRFLHERGDVESLAFVVMPDHLHWLFQLGATGRLHEVMHSLKRQSARGVNILLGRTGSPVWQSGFFDRALRKEDDLKAIARYIVANPIRAGLCRRVGDYPLWDAKWV